MPDQADKLRLLRLVKGKALPASDSGEGSGSPSPPALVLPPEGTNQTGPRRMTDRNRPRPRVRSLAVTSGKGGVGKTSVATNLAIAFTRLGKRVLLVDGDLSLANVDLLLGVVPKKNLGDVVLAGVSIEDVVLRTKEGVRLLPASSGVEDLADLDDFRRERLLRELSRLETDVDLILLDTGSGIGRQTIHLARAADQVVVVTTPEPTAFSDAYATLKVLSRGRLRERPGLVVNMATSADEGRETERRIRLVAERFLGLHPRYLGHIMLDAAVGKAVRMQEPLLRVFPRSAASLCIEALAVKLLTHDGPPEPLEAEPDGFFLKVANLDD
jgi:flagellar biosynthesis protein FlhG